MKDTGNTGRLMEVALLFFRLGAMSFGGPAAYLAIMHYEVVVRRKWVDEQKFLDILGATNLIPGPNATEVASHLGLLRAGWGGFAAAGLLFILPGFVTTAVAAWAYVTYGYLPQVGWVLYGVKPVILAIIVQALWSLGKRIRKPLMIAITAIAGLALYFFDFNEIALLFAGAAVIILVRGGGRLLKSRSATLLVLPPLLAAPLATLAGAVPFSNGTLFLTFLKIGATLYGSGYVLLAFLRSEFVVGLGWLTNAQVLDAVAVDQITPGPLFTTAAFIGYLLSGWTGALLATVAIFLPSFFFVATLSRFLPLLRKTWWASAFLDGVTAVSLGLMVAVSVQLGQAAIVDVFAVILGLTALLLLIRFKISSLWLMLGGGVLGIAYKLLIG
jgi:chromate transporter